MKLKNLIILQYAPSISYVQAVGIDQATEKSELSLDLKKGTWSLEHINPIPIGKKRYPLCREGGKIIGIYDRTDMKHLNEMIDDAVKVAVIDGYSPFDDEI